MIHVNVICAFLFQAELPVLPLQEVPRVRHADRLGAARRGEDQEVQQDGQAAKGAGGNTQVAN